MAPLGTKMPSRLQYIFTYEPQQADLWAAWAEPVAWSGWLILIV